LTTNQSTATTTLSFTLDGQSGTVGFSNVTIPKIAVPTGTTPVVLVDNQLCQNQGFTQDALNYYVWYTVHFSSHQMEIGFRASTFASPTINESLPGQINWTQIILGVLIALVIVGVIVGALILVNRDRRRTS
jgi:hypothetical protein